MLEESQKATIRQFAVELVLRHLAPLHPVDKMLEHAAEIADFIIDGGWIEPKESEHVG